MRYQVLHSFKVKTSQGEMQLQLGQVITLPHDKAIRLLNEGKVKPVKDVMANEFHSLCKWLEGFDLGSEEIKERLPALYQDLRDAIAEMDSCFVNEDLQGFLKAISKIRQIYTDALFCCGRRVVVKIYSQLLEAYLWVVVDSRDVKALRPQGVIEPVYTPDEIARLKGLPTDGIRLTHRAKQTFLDGTIIKTILG